MFDPELSATLVITVAIAGFAAGFIDSIAGGGGLISLPVLLSLGLPPHFALGTNKLQSALGTAFATANYARRGLLTGDGLAPGVAATALAAFAGAYAVTRLPADVLVRTIPWLLTAIFVYVLISPRIGEARGRARMGPVAFHALAGAAVGFYDGFFGPGAGSFWTIGFVLLLGFTLPHAIAHTKVLNLTSNLASLAWFALHGDVRWVLGFAMGAANIAGALLGSTLAIRRGAKFIRVIFLIAVGATIARLLWRSFGAS